MNLLWTSADLLSATGGRPIGSMPVGVTGISIDSRTMRPGEAFFAIKGEAMDGHDFATAAVKAGASVLVVGEGKLPALGRLTAPMIVVQDVLAALTKAGAAARARSAAKVVAVTGSVGKTSTKEALRHALSAVGRVHASDKSFNNHWGVPLTLARLPADADYAVFEIGMNHENEIRPLVKLVRPHVAIVTVIAAAHLGHFRDLDDIAAAKAEIFEGLELDGTALLNRDDPRFELLSRLAAAAGVGKVTSFGEHPAADYRLLEVALHPDRSVISVSVAGEELAVTIGAPGRHVVQNVLAVLGAAHLVGADVKDAGLSLAGLAAEAGRGRRHRLRHPQGAFTLIDESYNANPASMRAALDLLKAAEVGEGGRRVAVLGDMLELGNHSRDLHAELAGPLAGSGADLVLLAGEHMVSLAEALPATMPAMVQPTAEHLKPMLIEAVRPGDAIMIKSSKGIGFSRLVEALVQKFPAEAGNTAPG